MVPAYAQELKPGALQSHANRRVIIHPHAHHTVEQAEWIAATVAELKIESLSLFVSAYHLLRAYCTILNVFVRDGLQIPMIPAPALVSPSTLVPETGLSAWELVAGEVERIMKYQDKGDVISLQQLELYLSWLWSHAIMK